MTISETQVLAPGITWSEESPEFKSMGTILPVSKDYPRKLDSLYGEDISFDFTSGSMDDITSFHQGIVSFKIREENGSRLAGLAGGKILAHYVGRQIFPPHQQLETRGFLVTAEAPPLNELEAIAGGIMNALALRLSPET